MNGLDHNTLASAEQPSGIGGFLLREWPYLLMLLLSLGGVAYTSFTETELYWLLLTPFIGLVCVITRWPHVEGREEHVHLVVTQALHWTAVLAAMEMMSLQVLRQAVGMTLPLSLLTLLALGTFTAGLHIRAWKVAVVGVILGASVPAIALLQQTALLILMVIAVLAAIVIPFFWTKSRPPGAAPDRLERTPAARPTVPEPPLPPRFDDASAPFPAPFPAPPHAGAAAAAGAAPKPAREDSGEQPADNVRPISGAR